MFFSNDNDNNITLEVTPDLMTSALLKTVVKMSLYLLQLLVQIQYLKNLICKEIIDLIVVKTNTQISLMQLMEHLLLALKPHVFGNNFFAERSPKTKSTNVQDQRSCDGITIFWESHIL